MPKHLDKIENEIDLKPGEPMICSYNEGDKCKYMFVVKTANTLHSVPMFWEFGGGLKNL